MCICGPLECCPKCEDISAYLGMVTVVEVLNHQMDRMTHAIDLSWPFLQLFWWLVQWFIHKIVLATGMEVMLELSNWIPSLRLVWLLPPVSGQPANCRGNR